MNLVNVLEKPKQLSVKSIQSKKRKTKHIHSNSKKTVGVWLGRWKKERGPATITGKKGQNTKIETNSKAKYRLLSSAGTAQRTQVTKPRT